MALRLGVNCAVIDDHGRVLLSLRHDLSFWNLPGGRLDAGEYLDEAAAREVHEETGIVAHVDRAVGLYFWPGWNLLTVLFAGWPLGGELLAQTEETRANRYFDPGDLPAMPRAVMTLDALAGTRHKPRSLPIAAQELAWMQRSLRWRWVRNLLRGRPEPKHVPFQVRAVGVVWDSDYRRVLTLDSGRARLLPRVACHGETAPWEQLAAAVVGRARVTPSFRWVGVWQDVARNVVEFVFAATVMMPEDEHPTGVDWLTARNAALTDLDLAYVERVKRTYAGDPIWLIGREAAVQAGDTVQVTWESGT